MAHGEFEAQTTPIPADQEAVDKAIGDFIQADPAGRGAMQAQILLKDHADGKGVTQNAHASQKALDLHGDRMPEEVQAALAAAIKRVLEN
jgi:hypothetical protein